MYSLERGDCRGDLGDGSDDKHLLGEEHGTGYRQQDEHDLTEIVIAQQMVAAHPDQGARQDRRQAGQKRQQEVAVELSRTQRDQQGGGDRFVEGGWGDLRGRGEWLRRFRLEVFHEQSFMRLINTKHKVVSLNNAGFVRIFDESLSGQS